MKRYVNGAAAEPFFQKRVPSGAPEWLETATVSFPSGRTATELCPNDAAHLAWAVNLGVIDFNPWRCDAPTWTGPMSFASTWIRNRRAVGLGAPRRAHGRGGTDGPRPGGVFPRRRAHAGSTSTYGSIRSTASPSAACGPRHSPARSSGAYPSWPPASGGRKSDTACSSTTTRTPGTGTVASAYSVRPVPNARVSCPLRWDEVADVEPDDLRIDTVPQRVAEVGDPSAEIDATPGRWTGCSRWPPGTRQRALATPRGRRTFASNAVSPSASSRAGRSPRMTMASQFRRARSE